MRLFAIDTRQHHHSLPCRRADPRRPRAFRHREGACQARRQLARRPPGPDLELFRRCRRLRRRPEACEEVHGPQERRGPDLEGHPETGRPRRAGNGGCHGDGHPAPKAAKGAPKKTKATTAARTKGGAPAAREGSKKARVVAMLQRKNGATLAEIMDKMGWQTTPSAGSWPAR